MPLGDPVAIARGKHVVEAVGLCSECHASNLAGEILEDDPVFGILVPANLTSGKGGIGATRSDADLVRAIRHGVRADGTAIPIMPSKYYNRLSDADTGALIAYIRSLPPRGQRAAQQQSPDPRANSPGGGCARRRLL